LTAGLSTTFGATTGKKLKSQRRGIANLCVMAESRGLRIANRKWSDDEEHKRNGDMSAERIFHVRRGRDGGYDIYFENRLVGWSEPSSEVMRLVAEQLVREWEAEQDAETRPLGVLNCDTIDSRFYQG
jgi:hypothetical protein